MSDEPGKGAAQEQGGGDEWRHSKAVGLLATALVIASVALIVWFLSPKKQKGLDATFICESTGKTFDVEIMPGDEATMAYQVAPGRAVPCKFDEKRDAYDAFRDPATGKWRKATQADFPADEEEEGIGNQSLGWARGGEGGSRRDRPRTESTQPWLESTGQE